MPAAIRVLYVDDEPLLLEIAKRYLEKSGDFSVTTIGSASAALDMLKLEQFDAVISDYQMPDIDGLEFLQQVRHIYGQVPFILFTGRGREEVVILALNNGADFYLQKGGAPQPQFAELAHKIRQAVQRRKADIALLESERRYRDIVETQTEFISRFKPDGTHVFVNEAYCRHFGKRRDDVVGHRFLPAIPHEDLELVRRHFASLTRDHPVADLEHRVMMSDGSIRWHWWNDLAIFDEESNVVEYQSLGKDITDRKRAEESLLQERGFTDAVLESVPGLLYLYDGDGRLLRWNKGHETLTGYTPAELAGMHVLDWFRHSDVQTAIIRDGIERTFRDGHADVEADLMVKSGKLIPYFFTATLLEIQDRKYFTGIGIDMTPRKEAEKGLRESEEKFRVMAETAPVAIVVYQDTRMVYVNDYTARMTGYSRKELYDMDFWDMYHPDFQEPIKERGLARLRGEEVRPDLEIKYITKSGEIRWGFLSAGGITYGGKPAGVATLVDITDRKRTGDELRASYEQLAAAEEELRAQFCASKEVQQQIQQSELDYRSILENMQDVYYRSDDRGNLILASPSLATLLGYASVSELYGKRIAQVLYYQPEVRELVIADIQKEGSVNNYEVTLKKQDGTPVIVSTSSHEYFDADGNYRGIEGIFRDITERKDAEETLKKSENLYRTIFEMTGAATIIIEKDTIISLANSGFAKISGYSIEELEGHKEWTDFVVKEDLERMKTYHIDRRIDPPSAPKIYEFRFINKSGEIRHCINNVAVIPGTTRSVASVVDITDRVTIEQTLKESENLYRTIFNNTGAATIIIAPDTTILLANDGWINLTGVIRNEQENRKSWTEFIDNDDVERMKKYHYARRNDSNPIPNVYECKVIDVKNVVHHCFVYVDMIPGSKNSVASLVDITTRVQADELYQTIFENTGTAMAILEDDTTIVHVNEEMEKVWGYSREEIEGRMKWPQLVAEEDRPKMLEYHRLRRTNPDSVPKNYEFKFIHKNGGFRHASLAAAMITGTKKSVISISDITERKKIEQALKESEDIFRQLEGELPDYVIIHEGETIIFVNAEGARLMGKTPEQINGTSVLSYAAPEYHCQIKKNIGLRHMGTVVAPYDIEIIAPSGERRWVVIRAVPLHNREKPATLTVLTDITERKKAEGTLRQSEEKYRTIIENMQDLVYQTDLQGNLTMISPTGTKLAGYTSPDDVLGKNIARDLYADPKERKLFLAELADKGVVNDFPVTLNAGDGTIRYATASSHFYYDAQGNVLGVEGVLHDVTERKQAEIALLQANRKLNLLSSITRHDINNQLTVQMGYLELLEESHLDPSQIEYFLKVSTAARRISSMIRFMKEYEAIGITTPVWQHVRTLIENAAKDAPLGKVLAHNEIPGGMEVFADPLIAKVFYNLMDNAFRYGGKITTIRFSALECDGNHVILCEDDGDGVPANEKKKIFDRGFGKNTGLGLALSREILDITGITICETGEPGKGARFEITVPKEAFRSTGAPE